MHCASSPFASRTSWLKTRLPFTRPLPRLFPPARCLSSVRATVIPQVFTPVDAPSSLWNPHLHHCHHQHHQHLLHQHHRPLMTAPTMAVSLTNRCAESKSPYVRAHMHNATAWQLWAPDTLALARETNRLLFVSIGYSACHWCHVMERESFEHARIAQLLNEHFVPVKIDREERPDIDRQYMDFLQATSGGGGWPLNVFVTPDLEPIFGGTYWPGPDSARAPSASNKASAATTGATFEEILLRVAAAWKEQEQRCRDSAKQITRQLREFAQEGTLSGRAPAAAAAATATADDDGDGLELDLLDDAFQHYKMRYDDKYGGFGGAPKFPTPVHIRPLLRVGCYPKELREIVGEAECVEARQMAVKTLESMARGGIKDQIGHGFARYSVTRNWSLPHFEKMLYDNAQLLPVYLDAYLLTKSPLFLEMIHDIATYLTSEPMVSSAGGINASEDADSLPTATDTEKREGAYYVWTYDEIKSVLADDSEVEAIAKYYNVKPEGNIDRRADAQGELVGQNTLCVQCTPAELAQKLGKDEQTTSQILASARQKLLSYRESNRPRPALDDKVVTSWNGLAIGGLARASAALSSTAPTQSAAYLTAALNAASCIRTHLFDPATNSLLRVYRDGPGDTPAFAGDYAFLISGLLDLYEATFDASHLEWADALQRTQNALFWDPEHAGFFSTPANQPDILVRTKDAMDNAEPSVNGVAAANLFRLSALLDDGAAAGMARQTVAAFEVEIAQHPGLFSGMLASVVAAKMGMRTLMLVGRGAKVDAALRKARESVRPNVAVLRVVAPADPAAAADSATDSAADRWLRARNPLLEHVDGSAQMVQLCEGTVCRLLDLDEIERLFDGS